MSGDHDEDRDHGSSEHDHHSHDPAEVGIAILTVSSSRTLDADPSGDAIASLVGESGHVVAARDLVADDRAAIGAAVDRFVDREDVDAVVTTGGTGITSDDVTVEALRERFETELPGFGELFRRRSEAQIGTRVVATRATAGVVDDVVAFALPGSEAAVRLGTEELLLPEVAHLVGLARQ